MRCSCPSYPLSAAPKDRLAGQPCSTNGDMMITIMNKYGDPDGDGRGVVTHHHHHLGVTLKYQTFA
jgi:hypothetical protein